MVEERHENEGVWNVTVMEKRKQRKMESVIEVDDVIDNIKEDDAVIDVSTGIREECRKLAEELDDWVVYNAICGQEKYYRLLRDKAALKAPSWDRCLYKMQEKKLKRAVFTASEAARQALLSADELEAEKLAIEFLTSDDFHGEMRKIIRGINFNGEVDVGYAPYYTTGKKALEIVEGIKMDLRAGLNLLDEVTAPGGGRKRQKRASQSEDELVT